ncbi:DUF2341 domain-containing protein [Candidatus Woesearchaeota archaeon]|nr:DUF2341 domain-containing protein [Candidatus Woesearchaeota archaeon]
MRLKKIVIKIIIILGIALSISSSVNAWWNSSWQYRQNLTFDNSGQSSLSDFPVLIHLTPTNFNYSHIRPDGKDIRFIDSDDSTKLSYEIEEWNYNGDSYIWVKVPNILASSTSDYIWLYYNYSQASDEQDKENVWDEYYIGVWHLNETGTGTRYDSTSNNQDGTTINYDGTEGISAKIAGGEEIDGIDDSINTGWYPSPNNYTISFWVNWNSISEYGLSGTHDEANHRLYLGIDVENDAMFGAGNTYVAADDHHMTAGTWYYLTMTTNGTDAFYYVNATQKSTFSFTWTGTSAGAFLLGDIGGSYGASNDRDINGIIDEFRISNITRSPSWISATHLAMSDQFITYGNEQGYSPPPEWWNNDWICRKNLTFDNSGQTEQLAAFPVLVKLTPSNFDYSDVQTDGDDIRFVDSDNTLSLNFEVEDWNYNSDSYIWVNVPNIPASSSSDYIYMYFCNPSAANGENPESVWNNNYVFVQHLEESSGTIFDSTSFNNDGSVNGAVYSSSGYLDGNYEFDGDTDYISVNDDNSLDLSNTFTLEAWIYPTAWGGSGQYGRIIHKADSGGYRFYTRSSSSSVALFDGSSRCDSGSIQLDQWTYVAATFDESAYPEADLFLDGSSSTGTCSGDFTFSATTGSLCIGSSCGSTEEFQGMIDEVRISNNLRSDSWISASHLAMSDQFITFGTKETNKVSDGESCSNGNGCLNNLCIEGICRSSCSSSYNGDRCSDDSFAYDNINSGICARTYSGFWTCDKNEVSYFSTDYYQDCYYSENGAPSSSIQCDGDVDPSYSGEGICSYSSGAESISSVNCDTDEICYDDTNYRNDCNNCYLSGSDWDSCDYNVGISYATDGICVYNGECDNSGEACYNGTVYVSDCTNCGISTTDNDACDSVISDGEYTANGICVYNGECDTDETCVYGSSGTIYPGCSYPDCDPSNGVENKCTPLGSTVWAPDGLCTGSEGSEVCTQNGNEICIDSADSNRLKNNCNNCNNIDSCDNFLSDSDFEQDGICCFSSCVGTDSSDCCSDSDCSSGEYCIGYMCIFSKPVKLDVYNLGQTGFEQTNPKFSSIRTVYLEMNYSGEPDVCRYVNFDDPAQAPSDDYPLWSKWEPCLLKKFWKVSEYTGNKTVYVQVNFTTSSFQFLVNDSIFYNSTGEGGIDTTPPGAPIINDGNYSNNNNTIKVSWESASDFESVEVLGIPLQYFVELIVNNTQIKNATTYKESYTFTGLNLTHGTTVIFNVTAINSAELINTSSSDGVLIDLVSPAPAPIILEHNILNLTTQTLEEANQIDWYNTRKVQFYWNADGHDTDSGIGAYSYILTTRADSFPDYIPEGNEQYYPKEKNHTFEKLKQGNYYFKVRAEDKAGNWGDYREFNIHVDNTPPERSEILTKKYDSGMGTIEYFWSESDDISEIVSYQINLTYPNKTLYKTKQVSGTETNCSIIVDSDTYNAIIGAKNGAGIWRWSNQQQVITDFDPPEIIKKQPSALYVSNEPKIMIWTNEKAVCRYNITGTDYTDFLYTEDTYHESKIKSQENMASFKILCTDLYNNTMTSPEFLEFKLDFQQTAENGNSDSVVNTYPKVKTIFNFNVSNSSGSFLSGISSKRINILSDNIKLDYDTHDRGDGNYLISFIAPESPDTYILNLSIDSWSSLITLNVDNLHLITEIKSNSVTNNFSHIVYADENDYTVGIAANNKNATLTPGRLNLSSSVYSEILVFVSRPDINLKTRNTLLKRNEFLKQINPNFGFNTQNKYFISTFLSYKDKDIYSDDVGFLDQGIHNLLIINKFSSNNYTELKVTKNISSSKEEVFVYE